MQGIYEWLRCHFPARRDGRAEIRRTTGRRPLPDGHAPSTFAHLESPMRCRREGAKLASAWPLVREEDRITRWGGGWWLVIGGWLLSGRQLCLPGFQHRARICHLNARAAYVVEGQRCSEIGYRG